MSTHSEISWALNNAGFQHLVANFLKVIRERADTHDLPAEFINSALIYTNALFYEGSPYYQGDNGLKEAIALTEHESRLMFQYLRDCNEQLGCPLLLATMGSGGMQ